MSMHKHLKAIMALRRINAAKLAHVTGISPSTVSRILSGKHSPSYAFVSCISHALQVAPGIFDGTHDGRENWEPFNWQNVGRVRNLFDELRACDVVLCCTKGMPAYVQPRAVHDWAFDRAHRAAGWQTPAIAQSLETILGSSNGDLDAYQRSDCRNRVVAREWWVRQAFAKEPDWVQGFGDIIGDLEGKFALGITPDDQWTEVDRIIAAAVDDLLGPPGQWEFVAVGSMLPWQPVIAVIRPSRDRHLVTHHPAHLDRFLRAFHDIRPFVPDADAVIPFRQSQLSILREGVNITIGRLKELARLASKNRKRSVPESDRRREAIEWARLALPPDPLKTRLDKPTIFDQAILPR